MWNFLKKIAKKAKRTKILLPTNKRVQAIFSKNTNLFNLIGKYKYFVLGIITLILVLLSEIYIFTPSVQAQVASLNKSFSPGTVDPGQPSVLSVTLFNSDTVQQLTNASVTDPLPTGMTVANPPNITNSCGGTVTAIPGSNSFSLTGGTVPVKVGFVDGQCTFSANIVTTVQGNTTNTIPIGALTNDQNRTNSGPASNSISVRTTAAPGLSKNFSPNTIFATGTATLNINITNSSAINLTNVNLTDNLPANLTTNGAGSKNAACQGGSVTNTSTSVTLSGVTIAPSAVCTFSIPVTSTVVGAYTNTILANSITNTQGVSNASDATANLTVQNPITLAKSFSPNTVLVGTGISTLSISITNNGGANITGASMTDAFPSGLNRNGTESKNAACQGGTVSSTASSLSISGVTIAPGATCIFSVPVSSATTGNKTNQVPANSLTTDQGYTNTLVSTTLTVNSTIAAPTVTKSFVTNPINLGQNSVLRLDIRNNSASVALTNVNLTDVFPSGLVIASTPNLNQNANGNCTYPTGGVTAVAGSNQVSVSGLTIATSTTCRIQVDVTSTTQGSYVNDIPAGAITNDESTSNTGSTTATLNIQAVSASKNFSPSNVVIGQTSTLTVVLNNRIVGADLTGVAFTDNLPADVTIASSPTATNTCGGTFSPVAGANSFNLSGGTIPAALNSTTPGSCQVSVRVVASATGTKTNTIPAGAVTTTQGYSNLGGTSSNLIVSNDVVNLTKSFNPSTVNLGGVSQLRIDISPPNSNANSATDLALVDTLPTNVVIANPPNLNIADVDCRSTTGAARSITATAGGSTINISGLEVNKNTTCSIFVDVVGINNQGVYVNDIPANSVTTTPIVMTNPNPASATLTVIGVPVSKAFFPSIIASGGTSTLTVTLTNYHTFPLTGVSMTDNLPSDVTIATSPSASTTCGAGTVSATAGGNSFTLTGGTIPAKVGPVDGICTFQVNVTSTQFSASRTNTIPINQMTSNEGFSNLVAANATINFSPLNIDVTKEFAPLTVSGGSSSQLTITLRNPSLTETYYNVSFTDNMPTGMLVGSPANPTTTCTNGVISATPNAGSFSFSGGQIPPSTNCTVTVNATSTQTGNLTNTIPVNGVTTFQGAKNNDSASATLTNLPGVGVGKSFSPNVVDPNAPSLLTITILNADTINLTGLSLTDIMPNGIIIASPANESTTCSGGTVTSTNTPNPQVSLTGASLNANSSCTILVDVTSNTLGTYVNQIPAGTITTTQGATNPNVVADTLKIAYRPTVIKSFSPGTISPGGVSTVTLQLSNNNAGVINLTGNFIDNLPTGLVVANPPNIGGTCNTVNITAISGTNTVTYNSGATIPAGGCNITFDVTSAISGTYVNTIPAGALQTDSGSNPNPATDTLIVGGTPNVLLVKRMTAINGNPINIFENDPTTNDTVANWPTPNTTYLRGAINQPNVKPGDEIEYTIYFLSTGTGDATNFTICDLIPANTTFVPRTFSVSGEADKGIALGYKTTALADPNLPNILLTNVVSDDRGEFYPANVQPPTSCRKPDPGNPPNYIQMTQSDNTDGLVIINVAKTPTSTIPDIPVSTIPKATGSGTPFGSYGYVRFRVKVN
jgi:uncharacterized repeat protein (TIGR01451 family)